MWRPFHFIIGVRMLRFYTRDAPTHALSIIPIAGGRLAKAAVTSAKSTYGTENQAQEVTKAS